VRSTLAVVLLSLPACWNGEEALHKPCANNAHCGRGQTCIDRFCDGPDCEAPTPTTCDPTKRVVTREVVASDLVNEAFARSIAVVTGDFVGDDRTDLAVLSYDNYGLYVLENAGSSWPVAAMYFPDALTELFDLVAADLDRDGTTEFLLLSNNGQIGVVDWDGTNLTPIGTVDLSTTGLYSFTAADLVGDAGPDLFVSGATAVHLVPNVGGTLVAEEARSVSGEFYEPWDTLVVGTGAGARILVPESDDQSTMGAMNQVVHVLRVDDSAPVRGTPLGSDFQNPWAVAEGDFLGGNELEIAVVERRLNQPPDVAMEGTTDPGRLRFFRLVDDVVTEVGEPIEVGIGPGVLAAADLDCDGKTDLVLGNAGRPGMDDGRAQVLFGSCEASVNADDLMTFPEVGGTGVSAGTRLGVGDFDGDGLLDVAIPDFGDLAVPALPGRLVIVGVQEAQ